MNAVCDQCHQLKPRCKAVHLRVSGKATQYLPQVVILCESCRREQRGRFRLADQPARYR